MSFARWCEHVQSLLFSKHRIGLADVDVNHAKAAWDMDETPEEFVSWVEDRHGISIHR